MAEGKKRRIHEGKNGRREGSKERRRGQVEMAGRRKDVKLGGMEEEGRM